MTARALPVAFVAVVVAACGAGPSPTSPSPPPASSVHAAVSSPSPSPSPAPSSPPASTSAPATPPAKPTPASMFERLKPALVACYEEGRRAVPTMLDGKLTLNASIDANGKTLCAIPTEDTGLTQEVEDCMSAKFAGETFSTGATWTASVPVVVRKGVVELGQRTATAAIESIETHRMNDAFDVLETLAPKLAACTHGVEAPAGVRAVIVASRVGTDGKPLCALATTNTGDIPAKVAACASRTFLDAKFPPPKGGPGLILVPISIDRR